MSSTPSTVINKINNLNELIKMTYNLYDLKQGTLKYADCLLQILKSYHYWPLIKIKKFKNNDNIVLIHNSYKNDNVAHFQELYDECRSIVLDFSKSNNDNVIITYANSIPERYSIDNYVNNLYSNLDSCSMAIDGTMITFYHHEGLWYCGTSSCTDIDDSNFFHPTKTHGQMLNEILLKYLKDDTINNMDDVRNKFTSLLDPLYSYEFVLVHHENKHIIDYTNELGLNYMDLFHISTKNRKTLIIENIYNQPFKQIGIQYPLYFTNGVEAINYINNNPNCYGIIVNTIEKKFKVSNEYVLKKEEVDPCNYNVWYNLLHVYLLNKPEYNVNNYISDYCKDFIYPTYNDIIIDPNYIISNVIHIITDILYNLYINTTKYYTKYNRFKVNLDIDTQLNSVVRYHLAQLRYQQITLYKKLLSVDNIYYYVCNNNIKNIKKLIKLFYENPKEYDIPEDKLKLFELLHNLLLF